MKKVYVIPEMQIVEPKEPLMLDLPVGSPGKFVDDEAAKEQTEFEEEDAAPTSPNLWEDEED
ncbi:MAG: hypothetical protein J6M37_03765 [Prevotella sp.]|nr:hypothetical protein [Prevotella sp.]